MVLHQDDFHSTQVERKIRAPEDFVQATQIFVAIDYGVTTLESAIRVNQVERLFKIINQIANEASEVTAEGKQFNISKETVDELLNKVQKHPSAYNTCKSMEGSGAYGFLSLNNIALEHTDWEFKAEEGNIGQLYQKKGRVKLEEEDLAAAKRKVAVLEGLAKAWHGFCSRPKTT